MHIGEHVRAQDTLPRRCSSAANLSFSLISFHFSIVYSCMTYDFPTPIVYTLRSQWGTCGARLDLGVFRFQGNGKEESNAERHIAGSEDLGWSAYSSFQKDLQRRREISSDARHHLRRLWRIWQHGCLLDGLPLPNRSPVYAVSLCLRLK